MVLGEQNVGVLFGFWRGFWLLGGKIKAAEKAHQTQRECKDHGCDKPFDRDGRRRFGRAGGGRVFVGAGRLFGNA